MKFWIRNHLMFSLVVVVLSLNTCENSYNEIIYFNSADFTVSDMQTTDSTFFVKGIVKNEGNYSFKIPWYITYEISPLGGKTGQAFLGVHEITAPLECEQSVEWEAIYDDDFFREYYSSSFQVTNFEAWYILE